MMRTRKWIDVTNMNLWITWPSLVSDDFINKLFSFLIFIRCSFYENISQITVLNLLFSYLYLSPAILLQLSNSVSSFPYNKPYTIVRNRNNVCIGWGWAIGCHHAIIHLRCWHNLIVNLLSYIQLFFSNLVSGSIISWYNPLNGILSSPNIFNRVSNDQDMLIIIVIRLWCRSFLLRTFASNQNFASWFFF